jgi:hypothetical protein
MKLVFVHVNLKINTLTKDFQIGHIVVNLYLIMKNTVICVNTEKLFQRREIDIRNVLAGIVQEYHHLLVI